MILSIICPSFNAESTIRSLIDSIIKQSCKDYELIIVDGGSTDETISIVKSYGNQIRYVSERDSGIYDAMNKGVSMAKGEWLYFIGSDDTLYDNDVVMNLFALLQPNVDVVLCDVMSSEGNVCKSTFSNQILTKNTIYHQGAIYNKRFFNERQYDLSYKILADYEFNLYVWSLGPKVVYGDFIFANHSFEGISGRGVTLGYKEEIKIREKYISNHFKRFLLYLYSWLRLIRRRLIWILK